MCTTSKDLRDFDSLFELLDYFKDEQTCEDYLAVLRWNGEPECPHCTSNRVGLLKGKNKRYKCYGCKKQFSVKVGTIFHDSKLSLRKWFVAIYLVTAHKKGISSHQLARDLKISQKSAWFVLQRIRETYKPIDEKFTDEVEIDESWIGGKEKNKHQHKKIKNNQGRSGKSKTPVLGIIQRNGKVFAIPVKDTKTATIVPIMVDKVVEGSTIYTDEYRSYKFLANFYDHNFIRHKASQYVDGRIHTNSIESFWSHLKRGIDGIYHHVSKKHLDKYVNEYTFRFNNRNLSEGSKFDIAIANGVNKRLDYKTLIGEQKEKGGHQTS